MPDGIGNSLPLLQMFLLRGNQLTGGLKFLTSLSDFKNLVQVDMSQHKLDGILPYSIVNLSMNLQNLYAYENHIMGIIHPGLGKLTGLIKLVIHQNELTGPIQYALIRLHGLQLISISSNKISGSIPLELAQLNNLNILSLKYNELFGPIRDSLANISMIQSTYLGINNLSLSIRQSLWTLESFLELDLSVNIVTDSLSPQVRILKSHDLFRSIYEPAIRKHISCLGIFKCV